MAAPKLNVITEEPTQASSVSDRLLLDAWIQDRDCEAFAAIVRRYANLVVEVCRRQCRTAEDAEDAFQATFIALACGARKVRSRERLSGWLHQVAYRTSVRARSRGANELEPLIEDPIDHETSLQAIARRHQLKALDEELDSLPKKYRDVVVLHFMEGLTYDETATALATTEPAVRGRLARAKRKLQQQLFRRGISLSVALSFAGISASARAAPAETVRHTIDLATGAACGNELPADITSLVTYEATIMTSPSVIASTLIGTLAFGGLLLAQYGGRVTMNPKPATVVVHSSDAAGKGYADGGAIAADEFGGEMTHRSTGTGQPKQQWISANGERINEIETALAEKITFHFKDIPLEEFVTTIAELHSLPIHLDRRALDEIGTTPDIPVTISVEGISLESALELTLADLDLTYSIDHEVLRITSPDAAEYLRPIRIYWCGGIGLQANDASADMIKSLVTPEAWEELGGRATMRVIEASNGSQGGFAVAAPYMTHREIARFLESIQSTAQTAVAGVEVPQGVYGYGPGGGMGGGGGYGGGHPFSGGNPGGRGLGGGGSGQARRTPAKEAGESKQNGGNNKSKGNGAAKSRGSGGKSNRQVQQGKAYGGGGAF